ncbi:MAG: YlbF family regulator [Lachnospiraceae bacterium]|nr:YlbF family regulator [Lachnospiraceae bacterium]
MLELQGELDEFIVKLKDTKVYREYEIQKNKIKELPELKQRVDDFRRRNYELQTRNYPENIYDEMERFQRDNEAFQAIPQVRDFLQAELALCRMIQKVTTSIVEAVSEDFE